MASIVTTASSLHLPLSSSPRRLRGHPRSYALPELARPLPGRSRRAAPPAPSRPSATNFHSHYLARVAAGTMNRRRRMEAARGLPDPAVKMMRRERTLRTVEVHRPPPPAVAGSPWMPCYGREFISGALDNATVVFIFDGARFKCHQIPLLVRRPRSENVGHNKDMEMSSRDSILTSNS